MKGQARRRHSTSLRNRFSVPNLFSKLSSASLTLLKREGIILSCKPWKIPHLCRWNLCWFIQQSVLWLDWCCTQLQSLPGWGLITTDGQQIELSSSRHLQSILMTVLLADRFLESPVWPLLLSAMGTEGKQRCLNRGWTESSYLVLTVPDARTKPVIILTGQ